MKKGTAAMKAMRVGVLVTWIAAGTAAWAQTSASPAEKPPFSEKQRQLLEQTNALLQLAAELKVSVDKSTKDQLSLDVVRKAEAVEKMAKDLKGKIK